MTLCGCGSPKTFHTTTEWDLCLDCDVILFTAHEAIGAARKLGVPKYGQDSWRKIPIQEHLDHAWEHLKSYYKQDLSEDHLGHALCRIAMAKALEEDG